MSINIEEEVVFINALGPFVENQTLVQMLAASIEHTDSDLEFLWRLLSDVPYLDIVWLQAERVDLTPALDNTL